MADNPLQKLSNKELLELLSHYNLYATSGAGKVNVVPGPVMMQELKRRLS